MKCLIYYLSRNLNIFNKIIKIIIYLIIQKEIKNSNNLNKKNITSVQRGKNLVVH